jgi:16S rRNA (cytosine1402-N4)-methyltransferase
VLLEAVLGFLVPGDGLYLDATLGDAGHAAALLEREPRARLLGTDRDLDALAFARERLARFGGRVTLAHATFRELPEVHRGLGGERFAGALLDLGLSSRQIDEPARGMSFQSDGPLDLRMDQSRGETAAEKLAHADEAELARVLREYGDLTGAVRLARALLAEARRGSLPTTLALRQAVDRALGGRPHPRRYAQVFQALRLWVNGETEDLEAVLKWLPDAMRPGGVVVTLAYHSGEDRRIKQSLRRSPPAVSRRLPQVEEERSPEGPWDVLTKKVVFPSTEEEERNPRARSARLRAFRRKST